MMIDTASTAPKLHRIMTRTNRVFVCRQQECTRLGSYYGYITDWISTEEAGGWQFLCPACGTLQRRIEQDGHYPCEPPVALG